MRVNVRRYAAPGASPHPEVTVVVPTRAGDRDGRLRRLDAFLAGQRFRDFEVVAVVGDVRQGRAINRGVRIGAGRFVVTLDDDTELHDPDTLGLLVRALRRDPAIGIAGASTLPGPRASAFQRIAVRQVPRRFFPVVRQTVDSDMAQHPCMAMRRDEFLALGGEDEDLVRGLDPLLRRKYRDAGFRVVIVAGAWVGHPLPDDLLGIARQYFRNGRGSAFAQRSYPRRVFELTDGCRRNRFVPRRPPWFRMARFALRLYLSFLGLQVVKLTSEVAYAAGYAWEWRAGRPLPA